MKSSEGASDGVFRGESPYMQRGAAPAYVQRNLVHFNLACRPDPGRPQPWLELQPLTPTLGGTPGRQGRSRIPARVSMVFTKTCWAAEIRASTIQAVALREREV